MLKFSQFIFEEILLEKGPLANRGSLKDSVGTQTGEYHRRKYYADHLVQNPEGGGYILNQDHPESGKRAGDSIKLERIAALPHGKGKERYHGQVGNYQIPMSYFYKPQIGRVGKNQEQQEDRQIDELSSHIQNAIRENRGSPIKMHVGNGQTVSVAGIKKVTKGKPKADAFLHDEKGNPVHFMSLKDHNFQQWGGIKGLTKHPAVRDAIEKLSEVKNRHFPDERHENGKHVLPGGTAFHHDLDPENEEHRDLIHKVMYGVDHGGEHGLNNVHAIYGGHTIGVVKSQKVPGAYELHAPATFSNMSNDKTSDISPSKILVTPREGQDQEGTGGRIQIARNEFTPNSVSTENALKDDFVPETKATRQAARAERDANIKLEKEIAKKAKQKKEFDPFAPVPAATKKPAAKKRSTPKKKVNIEGSGEHGGFMFNGPEDNAHIQEIQRGIQRGKR